MTGWRAEARAAGLARKRRAVEDRRRVVARLAALGLPATQIALRLQLRGLDVHECTVWRDMRALGLQSPGRGWRRRMQEAA